MKQGMMKKTLPVFAAVLLVVGAHYVRHDGSCCNGILPLALILSPLGCSESRNNETAPPVTVDNHNPPKEAKTGIATEHRVTFVEIGSVNCVPCRMMQPIMKAVEEEYAGQVKIVFHDVWTPQGKQDAMKYGIRVIPTQIFLDAAGKEFFRHEGFYPKDELVKVLKMKGVR